MIKIDLDNKAKEEYPIEFAVIIFEKSCILQYQPSGKPPVEEMPLLSKKLTLDHIAFSTAPEKLQKLREWFGSCSADQEKRNSIIN